MKVTNLFALQTLSSILLLGCGNPATINTIPTEMNFVEIPSGSFFMGSPADEEGRYADEGPMHEVSIQYSFEMLSTEVTQSMWEEVMGSNPSVFVNPNSPVESISYSDCKNFIEAMNQIDPAYFYRLPTEAEWEYACRAGTATRYYSGNDEEDLRQIGWFNKNSPSTTAECGLLSPNSWGLYDMSGNVWEWCEDYYHDNYFGAPTDGSAWVDQLNQT